MNTHSTEFRTPSDLQMQARLSRQLAARRAAEAAREARFRTLPTPSLSHGYTPADETNDARWELVLVLIFAALATPLVAALASWLLPIVWSAK